MTKKELSKTLCNYSVALTVKEVSEILRISTKTAYKLISIGEIPAIKVGR